MNHDDLLKSDWMQGYNRDPAMTEQLLAAVRDALYAHPTQRLGQIIDNALFDDLGPNLFNVHDEDLIARLNTYTRKETTT